MSEKLRVVFNSPQCGWMSFELRAGEQSLVNAVSHTPYDSLRDLINALVKLLSDDTELTVKWAYNPDELDFIFKAGGEGAALEVNWHKGHAREEGAGERVFSFQGSRLDLCQPFWKALGEVQRNIEVDEFTRNWRGEFPFAEMQQLDASIKAYGQKHAGSASLSAT